MSDIPSIEALEGAHDFPGRYTIKAFGMRGGSFEADAQTSATEVLGRKKDVRAKARESSGGTYVCVTLDLRVQSAEQVRTVYEALLKVDLTAAKRAAKRAAAAHASRALLGVER